MAPWLIALLLVTACRSIRADLLDDWNDAALQAIRIENTSPPLAARNLAILHLAIDEAINSLRQTHLSFLRLQPVSGPASMEAAAHAAAFRASTALFPSQRSGFESLWHTHQAKLTPGAERTNGFAAGFAAAEALLEARTSDGSQTSLTYIPSASPGAWRRTLPYFRPPEMPHWGCVKPFVLQRCNQFRPPPPPTLASQRYAEDLNEVKRLGAKTSSARSAYDTETARFWSDFTGTVTPPGHWNQIARHIAETQRLEFATKARLLAVLNVALAEAGIAAWEAKFHYNSWRPVTAIRRAAEDDNPATEADPEWQSLLISPAFPEYVSGHSTFSGAAGEVMRQFFGRDDLSFEVTSDSLPGVRRRYASLSAAVKEIGRSRILGGIHFPSADAAGQAMGQAVGKWVAGSFLQGRGDMEPQSASLHSLEPMLRQASKVHGLAAKR